MSEKYKFHDTEGLYFVTSIVVHWIDLFTRKELKHIIIDSLKHGQVHKGLIIHAWCLLPSPASLSVCNLPTFVASYSPLSESPARDSE